MKFFYLLISTFIFLSVYSYSAEAAICGAGQSCFMAHGTLSNSNQSTANPITMYTAPSTGNGVKITGIFAYAAISDASTISCYVYIVHNSTNYYLFNAQPTLAVNGWMNNVMTTGYNLSASTYATSWPTDENGTPYFLLSPGDSIAIQNNAGIPSSGGTSGTYYFNIQGIAY